jgi:hypothetical protein
MKRFVPIAATLLLFAGLAYVVVGQKNKKRSEPTVAFDMGSFAPRRTCARPPSFLSRQHISQPVVIDLSQKRYKGIALLYGKGFEKALHPEQWEQYEHFSTYTLDRKGNIYLIPTPFISIHPTTFSLQKKLFRLDTLTGNVEIFMDLHDVHPTPNNPYGLNAIAYDCDDSTLWVASIDESDYRHQRGTIYHINPATKKVLQRIEGFDALTLSIVHTRKGKFLLAGSARDNALYAYEIKQGTLSTSAVKLLELPDPNEHIRKIKVSAKNTLSLQSVPFSYSLIARSAKKDRKHFEAKWSPDALKWNIR